MKKPIDRKYKRFCQYQTSLEDLLSKLEAIGDFDANAPSIRALSIVLYETMVYVRHLKAELEKVKNDSASKD